MLRRIEIEVDDVFDLLDEERIGRELEALCSPRLEPEGIPDPPHRGGRNAHDLGQRARRPVRGVGGHLLEGLDDHFFDLVVIGNGARHTRTWGRR